MRDHRKKMLQELNSLAENGLIRPHDIVAFAKDPKTALHRHFDWDNNIAGQKHRLHQARILVAQYRLVDNRGQATPVRALVSLKLDRYRREGGGYRTMQDVMADDNLKQNLLDDCLDELERTEEKYHSITELASVWREISKVRAQQKKRKGEPASVNLEV